MKIYTPLLIIITACAVLPLRAQPVPDTTPPDAAAAQPAPSPGRNIMPLALNHKPNPTNPPPEIAGPIDKFFKSLKAGK